MIGSGVGGSTGDVIPDGGFSGLSRMNPTILMVSLGCATTGMMGGGIGPSGSSAVGATRVVTTCVGSCKVAVTCSKLRVAKLSCVAGACPTDSPVMTETVELSEMSLAMSTIVGGPGDLTNSG